MKVNCWITMQLRHDRGRRRVFVKQSPGRNNKGLITRAKRLRRGDIVAIYVYNDQRAPRGVKYVGKVHRLLDFKVDSTESDGTQWLRAAEMEKNALAEDEHICPLDRLAAVLEPHKHFDNNRDRIRAVLRKCGGSVGELNDEQIRRIWPPFNSYISQMEESARREMAFMADAGSEPEMPGFPSERVKRVIERYAISRAKKYLRESGLSPGPYQERSPYDLKYMVGGEEHYLEVKGTRNRYDKAVVFLTSREVEHARSNEGKWRLLVVHSIVIDDVGDKLVAGGGIVCVKPWREISSLVRVCLYQTQLTSLAQLPQFHV